MKVIVIGAGPAGLAAAHAAVGLGAEVQVLAPKRMTPQNGPLLLQRPIPAINRDHPDGTIHQVVIGGDIEDYRYKLYGDINISINGNILRPQYHAWRHKETYDRLWALYRDLITECWVIDVDLQHMHESADLVVSTANAMNLCMNIAHDFISKQVAVTPEFSHPGQPDNTIIFNADPKVPWVRSSRVFGVPVTEWPKENAPEGARIITKPISTDCTCFPHVLRTGRFGAWRNETWVDTAYWDTYSAIESMNRSDEIRSISEFTP